MSVPTISPKDLAERHLAGKPVVLIDVSTQVEYREVHVTYARNVPIDRLDARAFAFSNDPSGDPLYIICRSAACERLIAAGCREAVNVEGGTLAWANSGLPVVRGKKAISVDRQVRIVAGFLILLGVVLGFLVHPVGFGLSAFIGAGLIFAGVTDRCGMALVLARMPWNRVRGPGASCAAP
jgi:rhodanese-related sulfurtransferase